MFWDSKRRHSRRHSDWSNNYSRRCQPLPADGVSEHAPDTLVVIHHNHHRHIDDYRRHLRNATQILALHLFQFARNAARVADSHVIPLGNKYSCPNPKSDCDDYV